LANSGDALPPWGVPSSVRVRFPFLQHAGIQPFLDEPHDASVRNPVLDELHQPFVGKPIEGHHDTLPTSRTYLSR
jgi:hypothetical protein